MFFVQTLISICGFKNHKVPHNSQFYRFLKEINNSKIQKLHYIVNKELIDLDVIGLEKFIMDSKPILANTKENNPKNFNRNKTNKKKKPKRNPQATLGYYSSRNDYKGKKKLEFFWGYRTHVIVDTRSGLCLVEKTLPNSASDAEVAKKLIKKLKKFYKFKKGAIFIGDKAYDVKDLYELIITKLKSKAIIPLNPRNYQPGKSFSENGHRICDAGLEMYPNGIVQEPHRTRLKERCPIKMRKHITIMFNNKCPINHPKFNTGKCYGCTAYIDITNDARASVQRDTVRFNRLYKQRHVVEIYNSHLQALKAEEARNFKLRSVQNRISLFHLSLSLIALSAAKLGVFDKINSFLTFAA